MCAITDRLGKNQSTWARLWRSQQQNHPCNSLILPMLLHSSAYLNKLWPARGRQGLNKSKKIIKLIYLFSSMKHLFALTKTSRTTASLSRQQPNQRKSFAVYIAASDPFILGYRWLISNCPCLRAVNNDGCLWRSKRTLLDYQDRKDQREPNGLLFVQLNWLEGVPCLKSGSNCRPTTKTTGSTL